MPTKVDIFNMALDAIGVKGNLTSTSDRRREAEVCSLHYEQARDAAFSSAYWPSLRTVEFLAMLAENTTGQAWNNGLPSPGFRYVYQLPNAMSRPRFIQGYHYFNMERWQGQLAIQTDAKDATLVYTKMVDDPASWEPELIDLVVALLAVRISFPLTQNRAIRNDALQIAREVYDTSLASIGNSEYAPMLEVTPPEILARGVGFYSDGPLRLDTSPYIYPLGVFHGGSH